MEKVAGSGAGSAGTKKELRIAIHAALALCAACPAAWADDAPRAPGDVVVAQAHIDSGVRVQVQTSTLPRMDVQDSGFQAPRVDVSLFPSRPLGYGLAPVMGMSGFTARTGAQPIGLQPQRPSFDLGLRWSQHLQGQQVDITAWRRMNAPEDAYSLVQSREPVYGARFEMSLAKAGRSSPLSLSGGFVGLQLESGARISVKRSNGRPMIYYRTSF